MNTQLADYCLKSMGIDVWHSLNPLPGSRQTLDCCCYDLMRETDQGIIGSLVLQVMPGTAQQQCKVERLMESMLYAVGLRAKVRNQGLLPTDEIVVVWGPSITQKILQSQPPFAELQPLSGQTISSRRITTGYHPLELLLQPLLKAKAWQDLYAIFAVPN